MNIKKIKNYQIFSGIFTIILGTILHFTFEWSGFNKNVSFFSSVNESTWEHLKLLFFPMLITLIIGIFYIGKQSPNFICSKTIGILVAIAFTIIFFYTYTGVIGKNIAIIDITSFFVATVLGETISYILIINKYKCNNLIAIVILGILFICFVIFTYSPPKIGLFKDPVTGGYGIIRDEKTLQKM